MSVDQFFSRTYNAKTYNCAHFVEEVWRTVCGQSIEHKLEGFLRPPKERRVSMRLKCEFQKLSKPESPCIVLFQRARSAPHVGVFLRGRVLHIVEKGVHFQPVDVVALGFDKVGFYK